MQSTRGWMKSILAFSLVFFLSVGIFGLGGCESKDETNESSIGSYPDQSVLSNDDEAGDSPIYTAWPFDADEALRRQEETAETLDIPIEHENEIGMMFRLIPAGEFMMGSPEEEEDRRDDESLHQVEITRAFYLGVCEVTKAEWEAIMETTPWEAKAYSAEGADYPATYVHSQNALEFCRRLSTQEGKTYRLPTEAEWEYACRAGSSTAFCCGDSDSSLGEYAWYGEDAAWVIGFPGLYSDQKHPYEVGLKRANAWGLYDMHGNVSEWCQDWYGIDYDVAKTIDPRGPSSGVFRVNRGGSWDYSESFCRSAGRDGDMWNFQSNSLILRSGGLGFRVVCSVE